MPLCGSILLSTGLVQSANTHESLAADQGAAQRTPAVRPVLVASGTSSGGGYPFSEYDMLVVHEAPDDTMAADVAITTAVGRGGTFSQGLLDLPTTPPTAAAATTTPGAFSRI
jgi:uncharacterized protein with GYD domain